MSGGTISRLSAIAAERRGMFTTARASEVEVSRKDLSGLVASGAIERLAQSVYRIAGAPQPSNEVDAVRIHWSPAASARQRSAYRWDESGSQPGLHTRGRRPLAFDRTGGATISHDCRREIMWPHGPASRRGRIRHRTAKSRRERGQQASATRLIQLTIDWPPTDGVGRAEPPPSFSSTQRS